MNERAGLLATFFSHTFRPLFLLLAVQAVLGIGFWYAWWSGLLPFPWERNPLTWHAHEMTSGFAGAAIAGFLLTAVATWTSRPAVSGWPVALLSLVWLAARVSVNAPVAAAIFDLAFWLGLWGLMAREIIGARNRRNYKVLGLLALLLLSDLCFHVAEFFLPAQQRLAVWAQLWLIVLLITFIGGRIIPAFTGNWLKRQAGRPLEAAELPAPFGRVDLVAQIALVVFFAAALAPLPDAVPLVLGVVAAALQLWRQSRWKGLRTFADPLVWMLHLAYAWIPAGVLLAALAEGGLLPISAAAHALGIGAMASMIVSVSARAALGHTGRPLVTHPLLTASVVLLSLAALLRIAYSLHPSLLLLGLAALAWILAFLAYGARYAPILLSR